MTFKSPKQPIKIRHVTVGWPKGRNRACKKCNSPISFCYVSAIRLAFTMFGVLALRFNYYACDNKNCPLHVPFIVPNSIVLPNKKFGRDVWEHVIRHVQETHGNFRTVAKGIEIDFKLKVSSDSVARIWRTYLVLNSAKADAKTAREVKKRGKMIVAVDGQRPQDGRPSLWSFIDVACNMVLHAVLLTSADAETLGAIFTTIEQKYGVPIVAVLSDHQGSILKAVRTYLPNAVHQACHFHFLSNLHEPLEAIDSHVQTILKGGVNSLYINKASPNNAPKFSNGIHAPVRKVFAPVMDNLKSLINNDRKKFDSWAGLTSFKNLDEYLQSLKIWVGEMDEGSRERNILSKAIDALEKALDKARPFQKRLDELIPWLDRMREILGVTEGISSNAMRTKAMEWEQDLRWWLHERGMNPADDDLRVDTLNFDATVEEIVGTWIALFAHHEPDLFHFLDVKGLPRSNVAMERDYSVENGTFRHRSGKGVVGSFVRVYGDATLRLQKTYASNEIQGVLNTYTLEATYDGLNTFKQRGLEERKHWKCKKRVLDGIKRIKEWLSGNKRGGEA